jgi:hypothetical protein
MKGGNKAWEDRITPKKHLKEKGLNPSGRSPTPSPKEIGAIVYLSKSSSHSLARTC